LEAGSVPPSLNFPQLDFVEPSSGFHPVTWERVIATSSAEENKGHYPNLDDFQEIYEDSMLIHNGEMMAIILHAFVPSTEASKHVQMLGDLFRYGGTCFLESRMALFGHRFCRGDLAVDRSVFCN
jgi:hypothetical protein